MEEVPIQDFSDGEQEWTSSYDSLGDFPQYQYGNSFSSYSDRGFLTTQPSVEVTSNGIIYTSSVASRAESGETFSYDNLIHSINKYDEDGDLIWTNKALMKMDTVYLSG